MANQGHGSHWECLGNLDDTVAKVLPKVLQEGDTVEKTEIVANCFENEMPAKHTVFSISINKGLSALALIIHNEERQSNEVVSAYPFVQSKNQIKLKITAIHEWDNLIESVIEGETENGQSISFFDTKYFKNKELYRVGETYSFSISALGYNVEILKQKSFSFEGQQAIDWLAKSGRKPDFDEKGNVQPVVFDLSQLVAFLPHTEYSDDVEFQSPINKIETVKAFDNEFHKMDITIFRDPDVCIDLYAKTSFFDSKLEINESLRGVIWVQGYLVEEVSASLQQSGLLNTDGEPIIN